MLSQRAAAATCVRMNSPLKKGSSTRKARLSAVPSSAISPATGTGNNMATDSALGNERLNATLDIAVGTGMRSTAAIAAIQMRICQVGWLVAWITLGSWINENAMTAMTGSDTASS